jgi:hypothetical protein
MSVSQKASRLLRAVPAFKEKNDVDPTLLIGADHMSDEASGPEEDSEEGFMNWKLRMAAAYGIKEPNEGSISRFKFLKKIQPKWHSAKVSAKVF